MPSKKRINNKKSNKKSNNKNNNKSFQNSYKKYNQSNSNGNAINQQLNSKTKSQNKNFDLIKNLGTRPALTMSVPVCYSAAAAHYDVAAANATTNNNRQQQQFQQQQQFREFVKQQQQQQQQELQYHHHHQQQQQQQQQFYGVFYMQQQQQEQLEQQQHHLASTSSSSSSSLNNLHLVVDSNNLMDQEQQEHQQQPRVVASTSTMAAAASASLAAAAVNGSNNNVSSNSNNNNNNNTNTNNNGNNGNVAARTVDAWMRIPEEDVYGEETEDVDVEGRYEGTPGAASLEYQKFEQQQQQQQQTEKSQGNATSKASTSANATSNGDNDTNNNKNQELQDELYAMSSEELYNALKEYDALQDKYHTVLLMPKESKREVTAGGRDGSAYVLRCLKMWYELPSDVLFNAMSLVDRFLDRMAVKPKHMACMSVASFYLAIEQLGLKVIPAEDLVTISQCGCTAGDLERMSNVIVDKLGVQMGQAPVTSVNFLRVYYALFYNLAKEIGGSFFEFYQQFIKLKELENRLENLLCDVKTTVITPSTLALVLVCLHLDFHIKESYTKGRPELKTVFEYILFLQQFMRIPDRVFTCGFSIVSGILSSYNNQTKQPYKQRLVWKLSSRTLRVLRPINRFSSDLPTIEEGISPQAMDDSCRLRTESLSSEEEEDWPTSPMIPIFEQC